jgi:hypothetical protein
MPNPRLKGLPLEALYEVMINAVKELIDAINYEEGDSSIKAKKRQCEMIHDAIILAKLNEKNGHP